MFCDYCGVSSYITKNGVGDVAGKGVEIERDRERVRVRVRVCSDLF